MTSSPGAICDVKLAGDRLQLTTIEGTSPIGICGSGIIAAIARLVEARVLDATGRTLPEFLERLNDLHTRVQMLFPSLRPPTFNVTDRAERSLRLHYETHRSGLTPFVVGLLQGLARRFNVPLEIDHDVRRDQGAPHDQFLLTW